MAFSASTQVGKMKHTFTGIRPEFPNLLIHKIINEAIKPFRVELMRRTEGGGGTQVTESLRTYMMDNLQNIRTQIQLYADTTTFDPLATLVDRKTRRDTYINTILDKANTAEVQTRKPDFTHSDEILSPLDASFHSITFDYTGQYDKDFAQPTPERIPNDLMREVVIGLDRLVVEFTRLHSSQNPRTLIAEEAAELITDLDDIYQAVDAFDPGQTPFHPSAISLNERDDFFNADGSFDPDVTLGTPTGEPDSVTLRGPNPSGTLAVS